MRNYITIISLVFLAFSCRQTGHVDKKYSWTEQEIKQYFIDSIAMGNGNYDNPDSLNKFQYFIKTIYDNSKSINYWDEFIYALDEPYIDTTKIDIHRHWLRLTVKPTFSNPYCITIEKIKNTTKATFKMTNGKGGYFTGYLILTNFSYFKDTLYNSYITKLDKINFWGIKGRDSTCHSVFDGTSLSFEAIEKGKYNAVYRHSPWNCSSMESQGLVNIFEDLYRITDIEKFLKLYNDE
ncbi:MAG: hypothetical protein J0M30_03535 [Chitinophagales bacterium]|nr:hypothetical protein [Chitinophagales bacterium]